MRSVVSASTSRAKVQGDQGVVVGLWKVAVSANADDVRTFAKFTYQPFPIVPADQRTVAGAEVQGRVVGAALLVAVYGTGLGGNSTALGSKSAAAISSEGGELCDVRRCSCFFAFSARAASSNAVKPALPSICVRLFASLASRLYWPDRKSKRREAS